MNAQGEFTFPVFHETVKLSREKKREAKQSAQTQDNVVYGIFEAHPGKAFAWFEILPLAKERIAIGEVSLKRALTNLKVAGLLIRRKDIKIESPLGGMCNKYELADKINPTGYQPINTDNKNIT